jgi:uncharacterized repeat protein (TIGR03803 family)
MRISKFSVTMAASVALVLAGALHSSAQVITELYSFTGDPSSDPVYAVLNQGRDGRLYGTTSGRRHGNTGSAFRISTTALEQDIYTFGISTGYNPYGSLALASDGNFYGTAPYGGSFGFGVLYSITSGGIYSVLHEFTGGEDGYYPYAAPIEASDGNLYGTAGGSEGQSGSVYRYTRAGVFATIYQLPTDQRQYLISPLIQAVDGNLYGTTYLGGDAGCGSIFKITHTGTLLYRFSFPCLRALGSSPGGPLMQASDGNFYGTATQGGLDHGAFGTIFKMNPQGLVSVLYKFLGSTDGAFPMAGLVEGTDGNLYGTTEEGGSSNIGTLFQITKNGTFTPLYSFDIEVGSTLQSAPMQHTNGRFYGLSAGGGPDDNGTVYTLDMGLGPFVTFVRPSGRVGQLTEIFGQGLTGTTDVTFNGIAATTFKVVNDTFMTAVVPSGATTGKVVVTTPGGTLTSNVSFRVIH